MKCIPIDTVYIDSEYAGECPDAIPVSKEEIDAIEKASESWQRFERPGLVDKGIKHIVIFGVGHADLR